jgi:hypothetical protein
MNDLHERLSALNPVPIDDVNEAARTPVAMALLGRVLEEPASTTAPSPSQRQRAGRVRGDRRRSRLPVVAAVAAVVLAGSAIAWAFAVFSARDTVSVQCLIGDRDVIIPATTGDPVKDCAGEWRRDTGDDPPPLVAYDNGLGGITVMPADRTPWPGFTPLPDGATQNVSLIAAQESLDDYIGGLYSGCFDNATAVRMTEQILERFDIVGWTVRPGPASVSSPISTPSVSPTALTECVHASYLDPTTRTVVLGGSLGDPSSPDMPYELLAAKLRSVRGCMTLDAATRQVRSAAGELGLTEAAHDYQLTVVPDKDARCATITESVGGTISLILRGPAG